MCDAPAAECLVWASHCKATHTSEHWRQQRELVQNPSKARAYASPR